MTTPLPKLCGITCPIFQAPMAGLAGPELAASVSEAGGLGHLGALRVPPKVLRGWIRETRALTNRPFGVNLVPQYGGPEVFEASLRVVLEERPAVTSLFYGNFPKTIPQLKAEGILTMVQVGSVDEAMRAVDHGADVIVAQGQEAGGHIRGRLGLIAFVPAVVDAIGNVPVVASGAIHEARAVRAVRALGAQGVWSGTTFLACTECNTHDAYRTKLIEAGTDDTTFMTGYSYGWRYGTPHRAIRGRGGWNLLRFMGGGLRRIDDGHMADRLSLYAGQGVGFVNRVRPAAEAFADLAEGFSDLVSAGDARQRTA